MNRDKNFKSKILNQKLKMFLIVGLGNPEEKYKLTRHNVGFIVLEGLAEKYNLSFKNQPKFKAYLAKGLVGDKEILSAIPLTYMNNSGAVVGSIAKFFKIRAENIVIIHDDLDLPFSKLRIRFGASFGGHKGIESIIQALGTKKFIRLRIGIGNELSASKKITSEKFVLQNFSLEELKYIENGKTRYAEIVETILTEGCEKAMNKFNANNY